MEFVPDKRHLWGGVTVALLVCVWIVYQGTADMGGAFYQPEYSGHPKGTAYQAECADCHGVAWKEVDNGSCIVCHQKRAPRRLAALPGKADPAKKPEDTPSDKLHMLVPEQACVTCHVEHRHTELDELLKIHQPARKSAKGYPALIHALIPAKYQGQENCIVCHTQAEIDAGVQKPEASASAGPAAPAAEAPALPAGDAPEPPPAAK